MLTVEETIGRAQWLHSYDTSLTPQQCVDLAVKEMSPTAMAELGAIFGADVNQLKNYILLHLTNN